MTFGSAATVSGSLVLSNTTPGNSWTGNTILQARKTGSGNNSLINGVDEVIPNGFGFGNVIMDGGTLPNNAYTWNLRGRNETINGLSDTGSTISLFIQNGLASTTSTLTVGDNNQSGTFNGTIRNGVGTVALTKIGGGLLTLAGIQLLHRQHNRQRRHPGSHRRGSAPRLGRRHCQHWRHVRRDGDELALHDGQFGVGARRHIRRQHGGGRDHHPDPLPMDS